MKKIVFCNICGNYLGEYKPYFAKKHLEENPTHVGFLIKTIIDPLLLKDPDSWFEKRCIVPNQLKGNTEKTIDDETEPEIMPKI